MSPPPPLFQVLSVPIPPGRLSAPPAVSHTLPLFLFLMSPSSSPVNLHEPLTTSISILMDFSLTYFSPFPSIYNLMSPPPIYIFMSPSFPLFLSTYMYNACVTASHEFYLYVSLFSHVFHISSLSYFYFHIHVPPPIYL
jgi:hypothetical protein